MRGVSQKRPDGNDSTVDNDRTVLEGGSTIYFDKTLITNIDFRNPYNIGYLCIIELVVGLE